VVALEQSALTSTPALLSRFPELDRTLPWVRLGSFPTPVEPLPSPPWIPGCPPLFVKREDLSSPHYGGNKVRTLETHLGAARAEGAKKIWAVGAYGSNHALATAVHAGRAGFDTGVMLFPQPMTEPARENLLALLALRPSLWPLSGVVEIPFAMAAASRRAHEPVYVMSPGGATPVGALAHVSAALELAAQVEAGELEQPEAIVLAIGSCCTTAGLLCGVHLAAELGIGFTRAPHVVAVRVTPWPVTSRRRVALLAWQTSRYLADRIEPRWRDAARIDFGRLLAGLSVERRFLGGGYGQPTRDGRAAIAAMRALHGPELDVVYSAKSGAALFERARRGGGPMVFWATKSSAPLQVAADADIVRAPMRWQRWLDEPAL
jgi:D-cysteine desulfhydrase